MRTSSDAGARAIAQGALVGVQDDGAIASASFQLYARLEDALDRIAATTDDDRAREIAEDALAVYRGR